jgi:hypothetical protein
MLTSVSSSRLRSSAAQTVRVPSVSSLSFQLIFLNRHFILSNNRWRLRGRKTGRKPCLALVALWSRPRSCDYVVMPEVNIVMLFHLADIRKKKIKAYMTWNLIKWACNSNESHQRCFDLGKRVLTVCLSFSFSLSLSPPPPPSTDAHNSCRL